MEYRDSRARVPLDDDAKRAAQKSTIKDHTPQVNPITPESHYLTEEDGYRPGVFRSDPQIHTDMQHGWRPSGSYSTSVSNDPTPGKQANAWNRRMVIDDESEYGHAVRQSTGDDSLYYRIGRPKMAILTVPAEFRDGADDGYEEPHGR
ncbi:hypothetical protein ACFXPT_11730 [Streptomyces goshikiensis]|uniref:hypothetical protein n=1 Tax=Streptomyces goshikiensis TaxID=1942 RepID=UPI00369B026C